MEAVAKINEEIVKRLNILITLLLEQSSTGSGVSMTEKIVKLAKVGVAPADIARILGKPLNSVTSVLSRRQSKKKEAKPDE